MTSVREQIITALVAALETVTPGNGYDHDFTGRVQRFRQDGQELEDPPVIVVLFGDEQKEYRENNIAECDLAVSVEVVACYADDVDALTATLTDALVTDCERAIAAAGTLGGLATEQRIVGVTPADIVEGQAFTGATIAVAYAYRHDIDDPRVKR